jgi:O-antigen/teichoic acid export membrane protein
LSLKKLGSETIIYGLSNILGRMLNFVLVVPFLTEIMSDDDYGVVGDLFFWTGLLIALLVFRMDTAVFRYASREENDATGVFKQTQTFVMAATAIVVGGLALGATPLATWLSYPGLEKYIYVVLMTVGFDVLSAVPLARLRLQQRPWRFVAANLGNVAVNLALIGVLLWGWPRTETLFGFVYDEKNMVMYYLISIAVASGFRYLFLLAEGWYANRETVKDEVMEEKPKGIVPPLKTMLLYSLPLTIVAVAGIINALVGPTVILRYFGASQDVNQAMAGQFNAALKLAVFLNLVITAYNYAAEPFFFRQAGNDLEKVDKTIYADAMRAYGMIAALACAGILIFLPWLKEFLGGDFHEALFVLPVLLAANVCFGLYSNLSVAYKLTDKTFLGGGIALLGSVVVISISVLLIGRLGLYAPAVGMLACYGVMSVLAYIVSRRYFPVDYPLGRLAVYAVLTAGAVYGSSFVGAADNEVVVYAEWSRSTGAMIGRGAVFLALVAALAAMEWSWVRKTFG